MRMLLEHIYIGHRVFDKNTADAVEKREEHTAFFDTILGIMKNYGIAADDITYDDRRGYAYENDAALADELQRYEDHCYWDRLIMGLAFRDAAEKYGERFDPVQSEAAFALCSPEIKKYIDEFSEYDISRLRIQKKKQD